MASSCMTRQLHDAVLEKAAIVQILGGNGDGFLLSWEHKTCPVPCRTARQTGMGKGLPYGRKRDGLA